MKGKIKLQQIELSIDIAGENWSQGDFIEGQFEINNLAPNEIKLDQYAVSLALGDFKKVKARHAKAFSIIDTVTAQQENKLAFSFHLAEDCPITDKNSGLYLLYGNRESIENGSFLQLNIRPQKILIDFTQIFQSFHRFQEKGFKNKKGYLEVKFIPPKSREYATIDGLNCLMRIKDKNLELKYLFKVKNLSYAAAGNVAMSKKLVEIEKILTPSEYLFYADAPDQDKINASILAVLEQVKSKSFF